MTRVTVIMILLAAIVLPGCGITPRGQEARSEARRRLDRVNAELSYDQAAQAFEAGRFEKALETARTAITLDPASVKYVILLGRIHLETHRLEQALKAFEKALELDEESAEAHYYAGIVFQRWSEDAKAYEHYRAAFEAEPTSVSYLLAAVESLVAMKRLDEARELVESKLAYFEHNSALRHLLGQIAMLEGDAGGAAQLFSEAWRLNPDDVTLLEELAHAQYAAGQYARCHESITQLRALRSGATEKRPDLMRLEARCLAFLERLQEARNLYLELTKLRPTDVEAWIELGTLAWQLGDFHRLALCGARVAALAPQRYEGYLLKGVNEHHHGNFEEAASFLGEAAERAEGTALPHLLLGRILAEMGDRSAALDAYAEAVRIEPGNRDAQALFLELSERELTAQHVDPADDR